MKRRINISFFLLLFYFTQNAFAQQSFQLQPFNLNNKTYTLELAESRAQKSLGLMHRDYLNSSHGMLFRYQSPGLYRIWMKNTLVPLSVLWLDSQAVIKQKMILMPCESNHCEAFGIYSDIHFILELNSSEYDRFEVGDQLHSIKQWANLMKNR